jgi:hypothetical protein
MTDIFIKFKIEPIQNEDHHTTVKAGIYIYDEDMIQEKIGFIEMVQFNFANAKMEKYHWHELIDEVDDDIMKLFNPLIVGNSFSDEFQDILDETLEDARSIIAIKRIFIKEKYRGKKLLPAILKIINKFNYCPVVLCAMPLQHATGDQNKKLMGRGKKTEFKKDLKKLSSYYESIGFQRVGKSKTLVFI